MYTLQPWNYYPAFLSLFSKQNNSNSTAQKWYHGKFHDKFKKPLKCNLFLWVSWSSWSRDASSALRSLPPFIFLLQVFELLLVSETALLRPPAVLLPQEAFLAVLQPLGPITKALILLQNQSALRRFHFLIPKNQAEWSEGTFPHKCRQVWWSMPSLKGHSTDFHMNLCWKSVIFVVEM